MEVFNERITTELHLSTDMDRCRHLGGSVFEFCLDYLETQSKEKENIGIKNIVTPELKKSVAFKCFVGSNFAKFDKSKMKSFSLNYVSFEELAELLEVEINSNFLTNENVCLDFSSHHSKHVCADEHLNGPNLNIKIIYKNGRFFLYMRPFIRLYISKDIVKILGFLRVINDAEKKNDYCIMEKPCFCSDEAVYFINSSERRLNVVLYEAMANNVIMKEGTSWPVLFSGCINEVSRYVGNMDQILTVRNLNCIFDNRFVLAFLDHKMNPFRPENDYRNNPLSFSLFFVKK